LETIEDRVGDGYGKPAVLHPDLPAEQAYVDHAYDCLDRMREGVVRALDAAATEFALDSLDKWVVRRLRTFEDAERGLCFGRLDVEGTEEPLYVGRRWVHDEGQAVLVVNWQAPAARPFYTATPVAPHGITLRRRFSSTRTGRRSERCSSSGRTPSSWTTSRTSCPRWARMPSISVPWPSSSRARR